MSNNWQPAASPATLKKRAAFLHAIREFFYQRNVTEVDTPTLTATPVTDPHIDALRTQAFQGSHHKTFYLSTSPEFYMKRLLAAGSGDIYQMGKVFRDNEQGSLHSTEFTMLEWYRTGFDHLMLMKEVDELVQQLLATPAADCMTYQAAFLEFAEVDPFTATDAELMDCVRSHGIELTATLMERDGWLALLLTHVVEPCLGQTRPVFITDFPPSQSALARIRKGPYDVAERFELYYKGIELANGYHELIDPVEQQRRFQADLEMRSQSNKATFGYDVMLLAALESGLPPCAGVALGVDRLFMLSESCKNIHECLAFSVNSF